MCPKRTHKKEMPTWRYHVISEMGYAMETTQVHTYGIRLSGPDFEEILHDISAYKETVDRMATLFNRYQLSPCHFKDAVEDLIS